eukprot:6061299-Pyramimonas_sp.AAC.1
MGSPRRFQEAPGGPRLMRRDALIVTTETHSHSNSFTIRFTPRPSILKPASIRKLLRLDTHGGQ